MTTRKLPFLPSRLLYVADKQSKCNYLIDTGAAVGVLTKSCANGTEDTSSLPLGYKATYFMSRFSDTL